VSDYKKLLRKQNEKEKNEMKAMEAHARAITFLTTEGTVKIPFFQRAYVWKEDNWEELISDLLETEKNHFLGSLILKQDSVPAGVKKRVSVIDGQQRLTTLSILLRALYNSFDSETQDNCKAALEGCLFTKQSASSGKLSVKIEHSKVDKKHYQAVINNEVDPSSIVAKNCDSNILKCFKFFTERLEKISAEERVKLFDNLMDDDKRILVVIDLSGDDDEQSIFDTINSAGVRLSGADTVKNSLFQKALESYEAEEVENLYKENWEDIFANNEQTISFWSAERLMGRLKRDNIEILLHSIAVIKDFYDPEKHALSALPTLYKGHISGLDREGLTQFIKEIADFARTYREKMLNFDSSDLFGYEDYQKRLFHILDVCDISTFHPYILFLYRKYADNEDELKAAFQKLETLVLRRYVCNFTAKSYNQFCKRFISDNSKVDAQLAESSDDVFARALFSIKNKPAALLLFWIELYRRSNDRCYDKEELKYTYTLEHIMPVCWEEFWHDIPVIGGDGKEITSSIVATNYRNALIYSIGNMTLLKGKLNSALRNYEFKRKMEGEGWKRCIKDYAELGITKHDLVNPYDNGDKVWDETKIRTRTEQLTADALKIWSL
jgi:hypothetical protein